MADIEKSALVLHTAQQMFELVQAIEQYPQFLPWCAASQVSQRSADCVQASLEINFKGLKTQFTTVNTHRAHQSIQMQLVDGPFSELTGQWLFTALNDEACKVQFSLQYQFSNALIERAVGPVFGQIANTMVDRFITRADALYG